MSIFKAISFYCAICCITVMTSCRITKYVPANDKLYLGAEVRFTDSTTGKKEKTNSDISGSLKALAKPVPNTSILGIRYRLAFYNMFKEPKKSKGLIYTIKHGWGRPPVLLSQAIPAITAGKMENQLFGMGFLRPVVQSEVKEKGKTATITYIVYPGTRYRINNIYWPRDTSALNVLVSSDSANSLISKGDFLDLTMMKNERERIDRRLKDSGYYYFSPDNILFNVDTLHQGAADLYVTLKPDLSQQSVQPWHMGKINVYPDYLLEKDSLLNARMPRSYQGLYIFDNRRKTYTNQLLRRVIVMHEGDLYQRNLHNLTIERLMNLNTLKFVRINFNADSVSHIMDTRIYMTRAKERSVRLEVSGNTKSNNFIGSEFSLSERNDNLFKGGETVELKLNTGSDVQIGGKDQESRNAYTYKFELNMYIPKIVLPFARITFPNSSYLPRTIISQTRENISRGGLYTLQSATFSFGYAWKSGRSTEHILRLLNFTKVDAKDITPAFDSTLAKDPLLRASFERQLMLSTIYEFKFNNTYLFTRPFTYAIDVTLTSSGNLASLITHADADTVNAKKIVNLPISQFVRAQVDVRGFYKISNRFTWANRVIAGVAYAYGNSVTVPYTQQFFIGGSSSLRGFRARTLGPGSYHTDRSVYEANQSGEIKFEFNSELRVSLNKYFKFATFTDAGNIWQRKDALNQQGSGFNSGDFLKEMAVSGGIGIRFDASYFLLRLDLATPFRKPWYPEGNRWVFNQIDLGSGAWRRDNVILNIGIGYPF